MSAIRLSAAERTLLDAMPVPVEDGRPVAACAVETPGGWSVAWMHDGGRDKRPAGPCWPYGARHAVAAANYLNERASAPGAGR